MLENGRRAWSVPRSVEAIGPHSPQTMRTRTGISADGIEDVELIRATSRVESAIVISIAESVQVEAESVFFPKVDVLHSKIRAVHGMTVDRQSTLELIDNAYITLGWWRFHLRNRQGCDHHEENPWAPRHCNQFTVQPAQNDQRTSNSDNQPPLITSKVTKTILINFWNVKNQSVFPDILLHIQFECTSLNKLNPG